MFDETGLLKSTALLPYRNTEPLFERPLARLPYRKGDSLSGGLSAFLFYCDTVHHDYKIENERQSESAFLLFAQHTITSKRVVIKMLRKYKDTRYSLETVSERQQCLLEALRWNRTFTHEFYIGLVRICNLDREQKRIGIDEIIVNPTKEMLDPNAEYGLLMPRLPESWRLDYLLLDNKDDLPLCNVYVRLLTKHVVHWHENLPALSIADENGIQWGSGKQIQRKLEHNFTFLNNLAFMIGKNGQYSSYNRWENTLNLLNNALCQILPESHHQCCFEAPFYKFYNRMEDNLKSLKDTLLCSLVQSQYQWCFEKRIEKRRIKRCHGDLKAPNIWIFPRACWLDTEPWKYIWVLDAIDFNPIYSNIDILSDFAMLVIDIYARTKKPSLAKLMIEDYLQLTHQQDEVSKSVLAYYLVEKAIVGAVVNILYDGLPDLGGAFLELAEMYVKEDLTWRLDTQRPTAVSLPSGAS